MKTTVISSQSNPAVVALTANVPNVQTKIFVLTVPRATSYTIENITQLKNGSVKGFHLILDLNTSAGVRISGASQIALRTKKPADEDAKTQRKVPYSIWREVSSKDQRNDDFKASIASSMDLDADAMTFRELSQLILEVDSPDTIDWSKSYVQFAVSEFN